LFATPEWAVRTEVLRRVEPTGGLSRVLTLQRSVLTTLLNPARLARLEEQEALDGPQTYKPTEFLADLREGLFGELSLAAPKISPYRRNLQRAYLDMLDERLNPRTGSVATDDTKALFRGELRSIDALAAARMSVAGDRITGLHLREMRDRIAQILDPKLSRPAVAASAAVATPSVASEEEGDWPDLAKDYLPQGTRK
jgi:hypothetical protein